MSTTSAFTRSAHMILKNSATTTFARISAACGLALTILSGCFSNVPFKDAPKPGDGQTAIYVYRTSSPPMLRKGTVSINNQKICDLGSEEFTWISLPAGGYWLTVSWSPELGISPDNARVDVEDGKTYFVKIDPSTVLHGAPPILFAAVVHPRLSVGTHPDQITEVWHLKYVPPAQPDIKPTPPGL